MLLNSNILMHCPIRARLLRYSRRNRRFGLHCPQNRLNSLYIVVSVRADNPHPARDQARSRYTEGLERLKVGDMEGALRRLGEAVDLDPDLAMAQYELGNCLRRLLRPDEAETALKAALDADSRLTAARFSLAFLYRETGRLEQARDCLLELCRAAAGDHGLLHQAGGLLADFGCYREAADIYTHLVLEAPHPASFQRLGEFCQKLGRFEAAAQAYTQAIRLDPTLGAAYMLLANTRRLEESDRSLQEFFAVALARQDLGPDDRACVHFALGKLHDDLKEYDQAFAHFQEANALRRQRFSFDREAWRSFVERSQRVFRQVGFPRPADSSERPQPAFVTGMLRSGTTLVERLLSNLPQVGSAGETELLDSFIERLSTLKGSPYPECVLDLDADELQVIAGDFRRQALLGHPGKALVLDKNPLNFMHIGLIALLFPDAPIIHCRRDPLDTCLSIYFQNFAHTRNNYAYDLSDIAAFYAGYEYLMDFWRTLLPGRVTEVRYEELATEPEKSMRVLQAEMGLKWSIEAIRPQANPATISTASVWQARQPIYTGSMGRWRNYSRHLQPLEEALANNRYYFAK